MARYVESWDYFADFTPRQLVGLFSCFTDIKVPSDMKSHTIDTEDTFLKTRIREIAECYVDYDSREGDMQMRTGLDYENALQYDIIDLAMQWCDCSTEEDCKRFIQNDVDNMSISIGDITKAMLKIVTIAKEWMNVFEQLGNIDALHKLSQIEGMVLKYITTSQSLYV